VGRGLTDKASKTVNNQYKYTLLASLYPEKHVFLETIQMGGESKLGICGDFLPFISIYSFIWWSPVL
jgi:hypothetical protein